MHVVGVYIGPITQHRINITLMQPNYYDSGRYQINDGFSALDDYEDRRESYPELSIHEESPFDESASDHTTLDFNNPDDMKRSKKRMKSAKVKSDSRNCCRRYWICWLVLLILVLLMAAGGITCYFKMPQIAQSFMDGSQITFNAITISDPLEEKFTASIQGRISQAGPVSASTHPMELTISHEGHEIGAMVMPAIDLKFGAADLDVSSEFKIIDKEAFTAFSRKLMTDKEFTWHIVGKTDLTAFGLTLKALNFDKSITLAGMQNFPEVKLKGFNLFSKDADTINTQISTELTNPSPISLELGVLDLEMHFKNKIIGRVMASGVNMTSGLNQLELQGTLSNEDKSETSHFSELFSNYVNGRPSSVTVSGSRKSKAKTSWLSSAMSELKLTIDLVSPPNMNLIKSIAASGIHMDLSKSNMLQPTIKIQSINVNFEMPFKFPISIVALKQRFNTYDGTTLIGTAETPFLPASNKADPNVITTSVPEIPMNIPSDVTAAFASFLSETFMNERDAFNMGGSADVQADTALGRIMLTGVKFQQEIPVTGMQGLKAIKSDGRKSNPVIHKLDVTKGEASRLIMQTDLTLYSPSSMGVAMGDVVLFLRYKDRVIGKSYLNNLVVNPGDNRISCTCVMDPVSAEDKSAALEIIGNYVNGRSSDLNMFGAIEGSTKNVLLAKSLSMLSLTAPLVGLTQKLVTRADMQLGAKAIFTKTGESSFTAANPFGDQFTITGMKATIQFQGKDLALIDVANVQLPIPARSSAKTAPVPVKLTDMISMGSIGALRDSFQNDLMVDVTSTISASLGQFPVQIEYVQKNVPAKIKLF
eukprot:Partr_v1_DN28473_c1_g1_i1_m41846 putative Protein of unknown function (DUF3712)